MKIGRLRPSKNNKGSIYIHIKDQANLLLWSKENIDEWMFLIQEATERSRLRRSATSSYIKEIQPGDNLETKPKCDESDSLKSARNDALYPENNHENQPDHKLLNTSPAIPKINNIDEMAQNER